VYGSSYQRWQIQYADGQTGWSAEDFLEQSDADLPGDYSGDGKVDADDYILWRDGHSPTPGSSADYTTWRQHFGQTIPAAGTVLSGNASVPEPASVMLLVSAMLAANRARRRLRR